MRKELTKKQLFTDIQKLINKMNKPDQYKFGGIMFFLNKLDEKNVDVFNILREKINEL